MTTDIEVNPRAEFSERLNSVLGDLTPAQLAKNIGVSRQAVLKWVEGKGYPNNSRLESLSKELKVSPQWLMFGENNSSSSDGHSKVESGPRDWKRVPIINWDELAKINTINYNERIEVNGKYSWAGPRVGQQAYALIVENDDMMPRYEPGSVLIIDPEYPISHKNKVIYLLGGTEPTCMQLIIDGPNLYLQAHIHGFAPFKISESDIYCGSIRQVIMEF